MEPTSPKGKELQRDDRYTLHGSVEDSGGGDGEFYARGRATLTNDPHVREQAVRAASYAPPIAISCSYLRLNFHLCINMWMATLLLVAGKRQNDLIPCKGKEAIRNE